MEQHRRGAGAAVANTKDGVPDVEAVKREALEHG